jgi:hypothetical protein
MRDGGKYTPAPMDTSGITLPEGISDLVERLAENSHENWAAERLAGGWRYGHERNDSRKEHPCLVPYRELSDGEKELDRRSVRETLKLILAMGYRIEKA